jgi:hypothetical protein
MRGKKSLTRIIEPLISKDRVECNQCVRTSGLSIVTGPIYYFLSLGVIPKRTDKKRSNTWTSLKTISCMMEEEMLMRFFYILLFYVFILAKVIWKEI